MMDREDLESERDPLIKGDPERRYVPKKYYTGDLKTIRELDEDRSPTHLLSSTWNSISGSVEWIKSDGLPKGLVITALIASCVACLSSATVSLPIFLGEMTANDSGLYTALVLVMVWVPLPYLLILLLVKCFRKNLCLFPSTPSIYISGNGVLLSIGLLLLAYSSPPWRTHSFLHPTVLTLTLPVGYASARIRAKQGFHRQFFVAILIQVTGIFVAMLPSLFNFARGNDDIAHVPWYYTILYAVSWCIISTTFATNSFLIHRHKDNPFVYMTWFHFICLIGTGLFFWTNVLPGLGMVQDFESFGENFGRGVECFFLACNFNLVLQAIIFSLALSIGSFTVILLLAFKNAITLISVVIMFTALCSTVFWIIFHNWPKFEFYPTHDSRSAVFLIVGLTVTIIGILFLLYANLVVDPKTMPVYRQRSTSVPVRITRRELFPTMQRPRHTTYTAGTPLMQYSMSAPLLGHRSSMSATAHAACTRGYTVGACRSDPVRAPPRTRRDSMNRPKSSPSLLSL